jgi:hypothetical protein
MSANTTVYVKILRTVEDVIEVSAITRSEAEELAMREPGVVAVLASAYERPELDFLG